VFGQPEYAVRCEWGAGGLAACGPGSAAVIIVDVLSFSTAVDVAVGRGARVFPYAFRDASASEFAQAHGALLASPDRHGGFSLSPASLQTLPAGTALVLPSPNGAMLSTLTGPVPTYAACLRNAAAVAQAAAQHGAPITVVAAGERWPDRGLRVALEDWLGAGAVVSALPGPRSPEAALAEAAFQQARADVLSVLLACGSGRELIARGCREDVLLAAALNVSTAVPRLVAGAYQAAEISS
jgi:2-phosphosulfolactate phosphatase